MPGALLNSTNTVIAKTNKKISVLRELLLWWKKTIKR